MHGIKMGVLPSDEISNTEPVAPVVGNRMAYFGPQQGASELRFIFPGRHTSGALWQAPLVVMSGRDEAGRQQGARQQQRH